MRILRAGVTNNGVPQWDKGDKCKSQKCRNTISGLDIKIAEVSGDQITMQGLSLSQNGGSVAKDDTKGNEEAGVNRHANANKKKNNEVELQGAMEELGNDVC